MASPLTTITPRGTKITLSAIERNSMPIIIVDLPGQSGIQITEGDFRGSHCLHGYAIRAGKQVPLVVEITPEIRQWLDNVSAERRAAEAARAQVVYLNRNTMEPSTWTVDLRRSNDEIIAGLPTGVLDAATEAGFREALADVRAQRATLAQATAAHDARIEAATAEAKASGKRIEISRQMVTCDGTADDCSADLLIKWANPDGTIYVERRHTF
jgi:hypothetical protein